MVRKAPRKFMRATTAGTPDGYKPVASAFTLQWAPGQPVEFEGHRLVVVDTLMQRSKHGGAPGYVRVLATADGLPATGECDCLSRPGLGQGAEVLAADLVTEASWLVCVQCRGRLDEAAVSAHVVAVPVACGHSFIGMTCSEPRGHDGVHRCWNGCQWSGVR